MKKGVLIIILVVLLVPEIVRAEGPDDLVLSPYNKDVIYRQEAAPYIEYVEKNWKIYQIGVKNLKRIEQSTRAEYRSEIINCSVQLELKDLKRG